MKKLSTTLLFLLIGFAAHAQQREAIDVKKGENIADIASTTIQYMFEDFVDGRVLYKNGATSVGKLNYNMLLSEMQFIEPASGNILALANPKDVTVVSLSGRQFIPSGAKDGFAEVISDGATRLVVEYKAKTVSSGREGAYGSYSPTSSSTSYSTVDVGQGLPITTLTVKEKILVYVSPTYYLVKDGKFSMVKGSKTFLAAFPKGKSAAISQFIKNEDINFKNKESLIKLTQYCNQL